MTGGPAGAVPADGAIDYWCNRFFPEQADVWNAALEATGIAGESPHRQR